MESPRETTDREERGPTSPPEPTKDATTPPANPEGQPEPHEAERAAERLDQAGGGH